MSSMKYRMKKPFNPMLSETYELVTDRFRVLAEKVEHQPRQIVALVLEGKNYKMWRHNWATPQFRLYGGRGMYEITETGCNDIYFSKYNQHYTTGLPMIKAKNLIFGQLYIDLSGSFEIVNHQSSEKAIVYIHEKVSDTQNTRIEVHCLDENGTKVAELRGSFLDKLVFHDFRNGETTEQLWQVPTLAENGHLQYFYYPISILMNYVSDDMKGFIPRTDSRWRSDVRLFEHDKWDEAEVAKVSIEQRQRLVRKQREDGMVPPHKPTFFKEVKHPFLKPSK